MLRFFQIAALLAPFVGKNAIAQDLEWDVGPVGGYPIIAFDQENAESEVQFKYNFTGTLSENKFLEATLYEDDCITAADASLSFAETYAGDELTLDLDIVQATITDSVHYTASSDTSANIAFCVRVDYKYEDSDGQVTSINFHETTVDISVDLTANFTLTGISTDRTAADDEAANSELDYPVVAYFCTDDNVDVMPDAFTQGSALQVCVKIDDEIVTEEVYVEDILSFVVSQPEGPATSSINIEDGITDPLTGKVCGTDGICNVKTQLPSKYFVEPNPNDLQVDGIALLAFGNPAGRVRRMRAVIRGSIGNAAVNKELEDSKRRLQEGGAANSPFALEVGLISSDAPTTEASSGSDNTTLIAIVVVVLILVITIVAAVSVYCCCFSGAAAGKRRRSSEEEEEEEFRHRYAEKMRMNSSGVDYDQERARSGHMPPSRFN